jgi:hypothetical protein
VGRVESLLLWWGWGMKELAEWHDFYVIVGSSAGALIGLQFVLMTLMAEMRHVRDGAAASSAFATPTVGHFKAVLLLGAGGTMAWRDPVTLAMAWAVGGVAGLGYQVTVVRQMVRQQAYKPELEDWVFHAVLPVVAYATLIYAAMSFRDDEHRALFAVAGAVLLLLVIGIHNAWDAASYNVFSAGHGKEEASRG